MDFIKYTFQCNTNDGWENISVDDVVRYVSVSYLEDYLARLTKKLAAPTFWGVYQNSYKQFRVM